MNSRDAVANRLDQDAMTIDVAECGVFGVSLKASRGTLEGRTPKRLGGVAQVGGNVNADRRKAAAVHTASLSVPTYIESVELRTALRSTGAVREFTDEIVSDATIAAILDDARFAPSGGNRQAWHVIVLKDPARRTRLGEIYLDAWHDYVAHSIAGLVPFSPLATETDRAAAAEKRADAVALSRPDGFPETISSAPVLLVVTVDLALLAAVDRDLDRYGFAGGASVYPFVWQILLAAREYGLGGVITTMATRSEPALKELFELPDSHAVAAVVALGRAQREIRTLRRRTVEQFTSLDSFDGDSFTG